MIASVLPTITEDFPKARKFIVRDASNINMKDVHSFCSFPGYQDIYCLMHMIINRVVSLVGPQKSAKKTFEFRDENDVPFARSQKSYKSFTELSDHLLRTRMTKEKAMKALTRMSTASNEHRIWKMLESSHSPGGHDHSFLKFLKDHALLYQACLKGKTAQDIIDEYTSNSKSFRYHPYSEKTNKMCSWGTASHRTLEIIGQLKQEVPLQVFTLCIDEHIRSAAQKYVKGSIEASTRDQPITFDSLKATVKLISAEESVYVHSPYDRSTTELATEYVLLSTLSIL